MLEKTVELIIDEIMKDEIKRTALIELCYLELKNTLPGIVSNHVEDNLSSINMYEIIDEKVIEPVMESLRGKLLEKLDIKI